jgi:hypothetical protein
MRVVTSSLSSLGLIDINVDFDLFFFGWIFSSQATDALILRVLPEALKLHNLCGQLIA